MKKDQLTKNEITKKKSFYKFPADHVADESLLFVEDAIINLIRFEYTANHYLFELAGVLNNTAPVECVSMHSILAQCYGIPHLEERVSEIISRNEPDLLSVEDSARLAAKEIRALHLESVESDATCSMILTTQMIADLLYNGAVMWTVLKGIEDIKCITTRRPAFEYEFKEGDPFDTGCINDFIHVMINGETEGDEKTRDVVFRIIETMKVNSERKLVKSRLLESAKGLIALMN